MVPVGQSMGDEMPSGRDVEKLYEALEVPVSGLLPDQFGPDADDADADDIEAFVPDDHPGQLLIIEYRDSRGASSKRAIRVVAVEDYQGNLTVRAWCYMRKMTRRFRIDRIETAANARTGEVIDDPADMLCGIGNIEPGKTYKRSGASRAEVARLRDFARPLFLLLVCIARADGRLDPRELVVLIDIAADQAATLGLGRDVAVAFANEMSGVAPTARMLTIAGNRIAKSVEQRDSLAASIERVAAADGLICQDELATLRTLALIFGGQIAAGR